MTAQLIHFGTLLMLAAGLAACTTSGGKPRGGSLPLSDGPALAAGMSSEEIASAKQLYLAKCARCHKFYDPAAYADGEWRIWMAKMSKKARLKPDQEQLLSRYLQAFRSRKAPS